MKNLFLLCFLFFIGCKCNEVSNLDESQCIKYVQEKLSIKQLELLLANKRVQDSINNNNSAEDAIELKEGKSKLKNYIDSMYKFYNLKPNQKDSIERSILLPYKELVKNIALLSKYYSKYEDLDSFQYRIYFGRNYKASDSFLTKHTAMVRICYDSFNIPDKLPIPNTTKLIRTLFNVGSICPPNCPQGFKEDMYDYPNHPNK
ncbi:MAG: hypothetical protein ABIO44_12630 [Saprospiraceae bacterium]